MHLAEYRAIIELAFAELRRADKHKLYEFSDIHVARAKQQLEKALGPERAAEITSEVLGEPECNH